MATPGKWAGFDFLKSAHPELRVLQIASIMNEGRSESVQSAQASGVKVLEVLKKHLFEHQDTSR